MGATAISRDETERILELAEHGVRGAVIGRAIDRSSTSIYNVLRRYGVPVRPSDRTAAQIAHASDLHRRDAPLSPAETRPTGPAPVPRTGTFQRIRRAAKALSERAGRGKQTHKLSLVGEEIEVLKRRLVEVDAEIHDIKQLTRTLAKLIGGY